MEQKEIEVNTSARYFTLGTLSDNTKAIWLVLHGYGQLAEYFIRNFEFLNDGTNYILAPEGFSKFYIQGFSGRVGATWMAKEDRLRSIQNNIAYLNCLYNSEITPSLNKNIKINFLGFSQGCATLGRWVLQDHVQFNKAIFWAGSLPPDMSPQLSSKKFKNKETHIVFDPEDPFLKEGTVSQMKDLLSQLKINAQFSTFKGGHKIDQALLQKLALQ